MATAKQVFRTAAKKAGSPLLNYVNRQFARMDAVWQERLNDVQHRLLGDLEANAELTATHARTLTQLNEKLARLPEEVAEYKAQSFIGRHPEDITLPVAHLANWLNSVEGFVAQSHLWVNHGIAIGHRPGGVEIAGINERVVEIPYVLQALSRLPTPSRIFDLGSLESLLPLYLASLGHKVTALDLTPYPFAHPNVEVVGSPIQDWPDPLAPFDAVVSLSALEHMGLDSYGQNERSDSLDQQTMKRFRSWLRPGGLLVFTAPFGRWHVDDFQRVYDSSHLEALLRGFTVVDRRFAAQSHGLYWNVSEEPPDDADREGGTATAVLVTATADS